MYEIQMTAINEVGTSSASPMATERTREAGMCRFFNLISTIVTCVFHFKVAMLCFREFRPV